MDLLFQLTDDEARAAAGDNQAFLFDSKGNTLDGAIIESYLFLAIALPEPMIFSPVLIRIVPPCQWISPQRTQKIIPGSVHQGFQGCRQGRNIERGFE